MIVTVQCVPSRLDYIKGIVQHLDPIFKIDETGKGCFPTFIEMLEIDFEGYRLHLQDDIILPEQFEAYLPTLEGVMQKKGLHVLNLFAPSRKSILEHSKQGPGVFVMDNFLWLQATIFSREFVNLMRIESNIMPTQKWDDVFVSAVLRKHRIKAHVFLPGIVQHNAVEMKSTVGNSSSKKRMSPFYDAEFIKNKLSNQ